MKPKAIVLAIFILSALLAVSEPAGQVMIRHGGEGGDDADVVFLRELGIVAGTEEGSDEIRVIAVMPDTDRDVALEEGDLVLMVNGKRVREVAGLREEYEAAAVGDVVKLGFRRGDERFLASFEKKDAGSEDGVVRMVMIGGPGSDFHDLQPLHEFGLILGEKDGEVVVAVQLPTDEPVFDEHDVVTSINGLDVASLADFREAYEPLAVGDDVTLVVMHDHEEVSATRVKAAATGGIRVRRGH